MANKGTLNGKTLLSEASVIELTSGLTSKVELIHDYPMKFSKAGLCAFGPPNEEEKAMMKDNISRSMYNRVNNGREGFFGWYGGGGACF